MASPVHVLSTVVLVRHLSMAELTPPVPDHACLSISYDNISIKHGQFSPRGGGVGHARTEFTGLWQDFHAPGRSSSMVSIGARSHGVAGRMDAYGQAS